MAAATASPWWGTQLLESEFGPRPRPVDLCGAALRMGAMIPCGMMFGFGMALCRHLQFSARAAARRGRPARPPRPPRARPLAYMADQRCDRLLRVTITAPLSSISAASVSGLGRCWIGPSRVTFSVIAGNRSLPRGADEQRLPSDSALLHRRPSPSGSSSSPVGGRTGARASTSSKRGRSVLQLRARSAIPSSTPCSRAHAESISACPRSFGVLLGSFAAARARGGISLGGA